MSSRFEQQGQFSRSTLALWERLRNARPSTADLVEFWMWYLNDVVPSRVSVFHVENRHQAWDLNGHARNRPESSMREGITLRCDEGILMTGLASTELNTFHIEEVAGTLAFMYWRDGATVPDHLQAWGMFTCLTRLRFFSSRDGREWNSVATFHPILDVRHVVRYIREEYERIRRR